MILARSWCLGADPDVWKRAHSPLMLGKIRKEDPGNWMLVSLTLFPGKVMEKILPESIAQPPEGQEGDGGHRHGFMKGNHACSTSVLLR